MNETVNRKYIFVVAAVAVVVLIGGALLRPKKAIPDPPSPSETASLQARVRRDELRETASFFAQRAEVLAPNVIHDHEHDTSAVAWEREGEVLTTRAAGPQSYDSPLLVGKGNAGRPPSSRLSALNAGQWLLVIGRTSENQILWTPAVYGGTRQTTCSGETYRELIVNARLDSALSGAAAFDLDGALAGVVANCDGNYHLISVASISSLLKAFASAERRIATSYGFHVADVNDDAKRVFSVESGLFVKEVRQGDVADLAGLEAGDVIRVVNGQAISQSQELWTALAAEDQRARILEVLRNQRSMTVRMPSIAEARRTISADASLGIRIVPSAPVTESLYVAPGTPAYKAGLRTGDRLIHADHKRTSGAKDLSRAISGMGNKPLLVVYQRDRAQKAALVSK